MRVGGLICGLAAGLAASAAEAGALRVSPVGLDLQGEQAAATLTLRNDDDAPMTVQVRVFRWTQEGGVDRLEPTQEVVASPPIGQIAPHAERVVRIVRTGAPAEGEAAYRLIVDELPPPPGEAGRNVRLLMRHSIPVFLNGGASGEARVAWRLTAGADGRVLIGRNTGVRRVRVSNVKLVGASSAVMFERAGLLGYVLPGAEVRWTLPAAATAGAAPDRLMAETDVGPIDVALSAGP